MYEILRAEYCNTKGKRLVIELKRPHVYTLAQLNEVERRLPKVFKMKGYVCFFSYRKLKP